jgi:hypothetical protein
VHPRSGEPLTIYGDGAQTRCFAHVGDVVRALADLAMAADVDPGVLAIAELPFGALVKAWHALKAIQSLQVLAGDAVHLSLNLEAGFRNCHGKGAEVIEAQSMGNKVPDKQGLGHQVMVAEPALESAVNKDPFSGGAGSGDNRCIRTFPSHDHCPVDCPGWFLGAHGLDR